MAYRAVYKSLSLKIFFLAFGVINGLAYAQSPSKTNVESALSAYYQGSAQTALKGLFSGSSEAWGLTTSVNLGAGEKIPSLEEEDFGYPGTGIIRSEREAIYSRIGDFKTIKQDIKFVVVLPSDALRSQEKVVRETIINAAGISPASKVEFSFHSSYEQGESLSTWMWVMIAFALLGAYLFWKYINKNSDSENPFKSKDNSMDALESENDMPKSDSENGPDLIASQELDAGASVESPAQQKSKAIQQISETAGVSPEHASSALSSIYRIDPSLKWPIAHMVQSIGLSQTLRLFPNVDKDIWDELRDSLAGDFGGELTNSGLGGSEVSVGVLKKLHRALIAHMLTMMNGTQSSSLAPEFAQLDAAQVASLLESESPDNAAAIIASIPMDKVMQASKDVEAAKMSKILKALSNTSEFSMDKITSLRNKVAAALGSNSPLSSTLKVNTEKLVVPLLSKFNASEEQDYASEIFASNPGLVKVWAKTRLYKEHLALINADVLANQLSDLDLNDQSLLWLLISSEKRSQVEPHLSSKQLSALEEAVEFSESNKMPKGEMMTALRSVLDKIHQNVVRGNESAIEDNFDFSAMNYNKSRVA